MKNQYIYKNKRTGRYYKAETPQDTPYLNKATLFPSHLHFLGPTTYKRINYQEELYYIRNIKLNKLNNNDEK